MPDVGSEDQTDVGTSVNVEPIGGSDDPLKSDHQPFTVVADRGRDTGRNDQLDPVGCDIGTDQRHIQRARCLIDGSEQRVGGALDLSGITRQAVQAGDRNEPNRGRPCAGSTPACTALRTAGGSTSGPIEQRSNQAASSVVVGCARSGFGRRVAQQWHAVGASTIRVVPRSARTVSLMAIWPAWAAASHLNTSVTAGPYGMTSVHEPDQRCSSKSPQWRPIDCDSRTRPPGAWIAGRSRIVRCMATAVSAARSRRSGPMNAMNSASPPKRRTCPSPAITSSIRRSKHVLTMSVSVSEPTRPRAARRSVSAVYPETSTNSSAASTLRFLLDDEAMVAVNPSTYAPRPEWSSSQARVTTNPLGVGAPPGRRLRSCGHRR